MASQHTQNASIRQNVEQKISNGLADEAARNVHHQGYHKLYVYHNGNTSWRMEADSYTHLRYDYDGSSIPILHSCGTGSVKCDCEWCQEVDHPDDIEWQDDTVADTADCMIEKLQSIPYGYFDDESL